MLKKLCLRFSSSFGGGSSSSPWLLSSAFSTEPSNASKHKSWRKSEFQTRLLNIFTYFLWLCSGNDSRKISYSLQICLCSIPVDQHADEPIFQGGTIISNWMILQRRGYFSQKNYKQLNVFCSVYVMFVIKSIMRITSITTCDSQATNCLFCSAQRKPRWLKTLSQPARLVTGEWTK